MLFLRVTQMLQCVAAVDLFINVQEVCSSFHAVLRECDMR
jgi:hypothetical protein